MLVQANLLHIVQCTSIEGICTHLGHGWFGTQKYDVCPAKMHFWSRYFFGRREILQPDQAQEYMHLS
jgi:hypothetical protein